MNIVHYCTECVGQEVGATRSSFKNAIPTDLVTPAMHDTF